MNLRFLWYILHSFHLPSIFILPGWSGSVIYNKITQDTIYPPNARAFLKPYTFLRDFNVSYLEKQIFPKINFLHTITPWSVSVSGVIISTKICPSVVLPPKTDACIQLKWER